MVELAYGRETAGRLQGGEVISTCFSSLCRSLIYPFVQKGAPSPISFHIVASIFISLNGYMQGRYLINFAEYDTSWFFDPRFLVGLVMFLTGLAINIHSDALLRNLRKPGETGYKIPCGEVAVVCVPCVYACMRVYVCAPVCVCMCVTSTAS